MQWHVSPMSKKLVILTTLLESHNVRAGANSITLPKISCCTSFWSSSSMKYNGGIHGAVHITWCWHQCTGITWHPCQWYNVISMLKLMASHNKKCHAALHFNCLNLRNAIILIILTKQMQWCHWWYISVTWCWCQWHYMTKSDATSHCDYFDQANGMVPLVTLLASQNTDTSINGLHDQNSNVTHCFNNLNLMNTIVLFTMSLASLDSDASANSVLWLKTSCYISLWLSWTNKGNCAIDDTISVMWCKHLHCMTKNIMTHLVSLIFT